MSYPRYSQSVPAQYFVPRSIARAKLAPTLKELNGTQETVIETSPSLQSAGVSSAFKRCLTETTNAIRRALSTLAPWSDGHSLGKVVSAWQMACTARTHDRSAASDVRQKATADWSRWLRQSLNFLSMTLFGILRSEFLNG